MSERWKARGFWFLGMCGVLAAGEAAGMLIPGGWLALPVARVLWVAAVGAVAAAVIDASVRRGARRLRALSDLARRISDPIDRQALLDAGLSHSIRLTGADAGCLRLFDEKGLLTLWSSHGTHEEYVDEYRRLSNVKPGTGAFPGGPDPVWLHADSLTGDLAGLLHDRPVESVVIVPLSSEGTVYGYVTMVYRHQRRCRRDDWETLRTIGTLLGTALANGKLYDEIVRESRTDPLTGLASRRHFEELYRREIAKARRHQRPLSLAMIDLDAMKEINDRWGHVAGDRALEAVGQLLKEVRAGDVAARYGGDEFVILMPETTPEQAEVVARRIKARLGQLNQERILPFPIRLSIGIRGLSLIGGDLLMEADAAMYSEKQSRKGRPIRTVTYPVKRLLPRTGTDG
jgi:diguanylate cyclase (GGDEF)-like protein